MDFVSDKINKFTGEALSGIQELRRKRDRPETGDEVVQTSANETDPNATSLGKTPRRDHRLTSGPFGVESNYGQQRPPPIGFRTDLMAGGSSQRGPSYLSADPTKQPSNSDSRQIRSSEQSLYEGDSWSRCWFQRVMVLTILRLILFIRKVYEDFQTTKEYNGKGFKSHFLIAVATLFLPTIVFTIYRLLRYLQITLPSLRTNTACYPSPSKVDGQEKKQDEQLKKALMTNVAQASNSNEDDGLVTARQSPVAVDDYQDATSTADKNFKESVDVDKLGNIQDKQTTRIVIGAGEQILHGILYVFWQLKRQVDVVGYLVERSCLWRKPREEEKDELERMRTSSDGLEWFQDFYAAFIAILVQVYTFCLHGNDESDPLGKKNSSIVTAATAGLSSLSDSSMSDSNAGRLTLDIASKAIQSKDLVIISQLVVSSLVVLSLLVAVRRRDDGPMTLALSMLGWGATFAARIIIIALSFVHLGWAITAAFIIFHVFGITCWIYKIAIDSHNGKKGESEEHEWDLELAEAGQKAPDTEVSSTQVTSSWSVTEHFVLIGQIATLFALPSLFYWPIMFNLKLHCRAFKYLALILTENLILIAAIWWTVSSHVTAGQWGLLGAVGALSIVGFVFISLYVACKPSLTEYFARADELFNEAQRSGIYFEFCSRVFKMPDLSKNSFRRLMVQSEEVVEVVEDQN